MKIAICFSGLIRTGCLASDNLLNYFGDLLPFCDFFIHTWDYENQATPFTDSINSGNDLYYNIKNYIPHKLQKSKINKFDSIYHPKIFQIDSYDIFLEYQKNKQSGNIIYPLWVSFYESIRIVDEYQKRNGIEYDFMIKIRPDLLLNPKHSLKNDIELLLNLPDNTFLICNLGNNELNKMSIFTDDVLFISRANYMKKVSEYGSPTGNHEYLMKFLLDIGVLPYNLVSSIYTILRPYSSHLNPIDDFELIRQYDFAYYSSEEHYNTIYEKKIIDL